jgi:predicted Co/Zn/Cd cation transporter (cation efflux family)
MSEHHWQPSLRSWVIGGVLSLAAFAAFAIAEGLASGFQLLALILLLDALVVAIFAFIHRVK